MLSYVHILHFRICIHTNVFFLIQERVINKSATSNKAILYSPNGQQSWNWKNWKTFLGRQFKALKGIREYQQFRFLAEHPGVVFVKRSEDSTETSVNIHNGLQVTPIHPPTVTAAGLTDARKLYLATHIRPYLRDINKDLTCPQPEE